MSPPEIPATLTATRFLGSPIRPNSKNESSFRQSFNRSHALNWNFCCGFEQSGLAFDILFTIARQQKHQQTRYESGQRQQLNREWTIGPKAIKQSPYDKGTGCAPNGIRGPGECVQGRQALEAEVAAQQVRGDVTLAAHAEADEGCGNQSRRQGM